MIEVSRAYEMLAARMKALGAAGRSTKTISEPTASEKVDLVAVSMEIRMGTASHPRPYSGFTSIASRALLKVLE